jgi:hypothetical protein
MRLVMGNQSTLNPFSPLKIVRHDNMTEGERKKYQSDLRALIGTLHFDQKKIDEVKQKLVNLWNLSQGRADGELANAS